MGQQRGSLNGLSGLIDVINPGNSNGTTPSIFLLNECTINVASYGAHLGNTHGRSITVNGIASNNSETSELGDEFGSGDFS